MPDYARIYARQEYLTPGAAETVEIIAETVKPTEGSILLDVACGKGEAAAASPAESPPSSFSGRSSTTPRPRRGSSTCAISSRSCAPMAGAYPPAMAHSTRHTASARRR
jgi:hypothetical protein